MAESISSATASRKPPTAVNTFAKFILSTPLHTLFSKHLMLLTFKGRKSGRMLTIPVGYQREGTVVKCFTDHSWWKNLKANPEVTLRIKGQNRTGRAEVIHDDKALVADELENYTRYSSGAARAFRIELDEHKQPVRSAVLAASQGVTLIRIHLDG